MKEPIGDGGQRLHDTSVEWWGEDGPTGEGRLPVFVVTHTNTPPTGVCSSFVHPDAPAPASPKRSSKSAAGVAGDAPD